MQTKHAETLAEKNSITPESVFAQIASHPGAVWLDSSLKVGDRGNRSFIAHNPIIDTQFDGHQIIEKYSDKDAEISTGQTIYERLEGYFSDPNLFGVGYIDYESSLSFIGLKSRHKPSLPSVRFLFYDEHLSYDHLTETWQIHGRSDKFLHERLVTGSIVDDALSASNEVNSSECEINPTESFSEYCKSIAEIGNFIYEGDIYQANYTTRFETKTPLKPFDLYRKLRQLNPAPYSCYLNFGDYQVLSSSPERLFVREHEHISCGPIKGTIGVGTTENEILQMQAKLCQSEKDRAELLMIVDLVRNDLGKIAQTGTVKVDSIFRPEAYASLIHLVSDISAQLRPSIRYEDIFRALLPAGSITGAPKKRAVEIINKLERSPRSLYTGAIGYINGSHSDFNLAIRTMTHKNGLYTIAGGGGIVADSEPENEYSEMRLKVSKLFEAVGADL